jgi:fructose-1,6-bisphosphatase-3
MALAEHKPYSPLAPDGTQVFNTPEIHVVETLKQRMTVKDTDIGKTLVRSIEELTELVEAFRKGIIKENV